MNRLALKRFTHAVTVQLSAISNVIVQWAIGFGYLHYNNVITIPLITLLGAQYFTLCVLVLYQVKCILTIISRALAPA